MQVGEVRVAEDADFERFRNLCQCHDGWKQDYNKGSTTVWTKANDQSYFKMIKVRKKYLIHCNANIRMYLITLLALDVIVVYITGNMNIILGKD